MSARAAVEDYYEALRRGEPLYPYFVESAETYKAAISTTYEGYDAVAEALREQTRTTTDWTVEGDGPTVVERDGWAAFHDEVTLAWSDAGEDENHDGEDGNHDGEDGNHHDEDGDRHEFETRWSGVLEERDGEWLFLELHVSTAGEV